MNKTTNGINTIEIWEPRYRDDVVLIAKRKVQPLNHIVFTKAKHLAGKTYFISGGEIAMHPLETNGKILCYAVPMDALHEQMELEIPKEYQ